MFLDVRYFGEGHGKPRTTEGETVFQRSRLTPLQPGHERIWVDVWGGIQKEVL